ncbi:MAG: diguanylate cyclase [Steroidobacteraceae bacterium]
MSRFWRFIFLCVLACLNLNQAIAAASDTHPVTLTGNWSYHWGELPRTASGWAFDQAAWQSTSAPEGIDGRGAARTLWLRLQLPQGAWRDPYLFIPSVDLSTQVFDSEALLYQFGDFDAQGRSRFLGWPWHLVSVPVNDLGQVLYFRVYSDYADIGLSGEVLLGERAELLQRVYARGFAGLVFALVVFIVGFISMCLGLIKRDHGVALATGILSFDLALMMFAENELTQVAYFAPLLWRYVAAFSYFLVPALLAWVVLEWRKQAPPRSVRPVICCSVLYALGVLLASLGGFNFINAYPAFDVLFIVLVLALLTDSLLQMRRVGVEGVLVALGMLTVFVSLLVDMASAHGLIQWIGRAGQWGLACFALSSLAVYLVRDWHQQIELNRLKHSLELQVAERTCELLSSQQQLLQLANEDALTGLLNRRAFMARAIEVIKQAMQQGRPLSLVLFDVDHFKLINDQHGHAVGDEVLRAIAHAVRDNSRAEDLLCRYGGEEFVMLMPMTHADVAERYVQRLRAAIAELRLDKPAGNQERRALQVSVSIGLVALGDATQQALDPVKMLDQILSQADAAMYKVKNNGRNGVELRHGLWASDTAAWLAARRITN